jgi:3-oxoadipate enol-lactonase
LETAIIEENYCPVSNGRLFFLKAGIGPPLLFLHGFCLDHRMWEGQINYFSDRYTCVSVDLRGFGKSSLPTDQSYSNHEDLNELFAFLEINQPAVLVGLSMGARVAVNFALTYPQKTSAIILADGAIDGFTFNDFNLTHIYSAGKELGVLVANRMWLDHPIFESARKNTVVLQKLTEQLLSYSGWHWTNKNPGRILTPPAIEQLRKITMPTLILIGQLDIPDFKALAQLLNNQIKHSSKIEISGAGHMCNMEKQDIFNDLVNQFLIRIQY